MAYQVYQVYSPQGEDPTWQVLYSGPHDQATAQSEAQRMTAECPRYRFVVREDTSPEEFPPDPYPTAEHRWPDLCARCGGECCRIYADEHRPLDAWFEEHVTQFHADRECYGVPPLFDPLEAHRSDRQHLWEELLTRGIDPNACEYRGPQGCIIPWIKRPSQCKEYRCTGWLRRMLNDQTPPPPEPEWLVGGRSLVNLYDLQDGLLLARKGQVLSEKTVAKIVAAGVMPHARVETCYYGFSEAQFRFLVEQSHCLIPVEKLADGDYLCLDWGVRDLRAGERFGPYILTVDGNLQGVTLHYQRQHGAVL